MLNKKQSIKSNEDWIKAVDNSINMFSKEYIDTVTDNTISVIKEVSSKYNNICSGWIAGKDSQVLQDILIKSGVKFTPIMWRGINEWNAVKKWIEEHKPKNLIIEVIDKFNFEFLEKNPNYLFCPNNEIMQKWMSEKWKRYKKDIVKYGFDLFVTGRRLIDGNKCGDKYNNYVMKGDKYDVFSPLAKWSHEELFAYIKYNNIKLSPFYDFPRGFLIGSIAMGEWTEYACKGKNINEVWEEVYNIDKDVVLNAGKYLTSAKNFLKNKELL